MCVSWVSSGYSRGVFGVSSWYCPGISSKSKSLRCLFMKISRGGLLMMKGKASWRLDEFYCCGVGYVFFVFVVMCKYYYSRLIIQELFLVHVIV